MAERKMDIPPSVQAVGRAGAGVNNIPVDKIGVVDFVEIVDV